ncbi:hypothetical protein [Metabacillus fastidiosus]|uniref:hypothetical protein n=1 Tax=Metabacillus fastidiosus TaxID=1458 RepID=UPI003D28EAF4
MGKKTYYADVNDTDITVNNGKKDLLDKVFKLLESRGFKIQTDQRILKEHPILADTHWEGSKGDLQFKSHIYPAGFDIKFFQEVVAENRYGGYYDFDKLEKMPYLIKCEFLITSKHICSLLESEGYSNRAEPSFKYALDKVMYKIKSCWHYKEGKELPNYEFPSYNAKDRDDKQIYNGQTKYFRDRKGRLKRGIVYHNINNMWWVILNKKDYTNVGAYELFDLTTREDRIPKIYNREIPYRVKVEKARSRFNKEFSYSMLKEIHINYLRLLVSQELIDHDKEINMSLKTPLKKDTAILKTKGLKYAAINVNGSYFSNREGITFNQDGFIGFAGWASGYNLKPFVDAFEKWMDWLQETSKQVA